VSLGRKIHAPQILVKKVKRERFRDVKYKEYIVSEDFILSMFSDTISKLHKQNPPFPLSKVDHKEITCMTTVENPILPHEKLLFRLEYWTVNNRSPNKIVVPNFQHKTPCTSPLWILSIIFVNTGLPGCFADIDSVNVSITTSPICFPIEWSLEYGAIEYLGGSV
jgi:hypothetical protein